MKREGIRREPTAPPRPGGAGVTLSRLLGSWLLGMYGVGLLGFTLFLLLWLPLHREAAELATELAEAQRLADRIVTTTYQQLLLSRDYLATRDPVALDRFHGLGDQLHLDLIRYTTKPLTLEDRTTVRQIKALHARMEVVAQHAFGLAARDLVADANVKAREVADYGGALAAAVARLVESRAQQQQRVIASQKRVATLQIAGIVVIAAILLVASLVFIGVVQQQVVSRLRTLMTVARRIGSGALDARMDENGVQELRTLARTFNDMGVSLMLAREQLSERTAALVQAEKMSATGRMLAGLAHELNNPLAAVLGYADLLRDDGEPPHERAAALTDLRREALRARDLVRSLLRFSRTGTPQVTGVRVADALHIVLDLRGYALAQQNIRLEAAAPDSAVVYAEELGLQQILLNLVNNSADAIRPGSGVIRIRYSSKADHALLVVEDTGPGFDDADRALEPFYTTKPPGSGTGLGLSLANILAESFGGRIETANGPEGGACVTVHLRTAPQASAAEGTRVAERDDSVELDSSAGHTMTPATQPASDRPIVLVVEDEPAILRLHRRMLAKLDVQVVEASDGSSALHTLRQGRVDFVVSDIRMPGEIDGFKLWAWIQAERPDLARRVVFVTGDIDQQVSSRLGGLPPGRLLSKPFTQSEYQALIGDVLSEEAHETV